MQSDDAHCLDKKIRNCGWHFIWIAKESLKGGVGQSPQGAIANALKLALRGVDEQFNAAEVERIQLTHYPWFFVARVTVYPFQIQQSPDLSLAAERRPLRIAPPADAIVMTGNQSSTAFSRGISLSN
ncbi:MAG: hypothetical protein WBP63_01290 [Silvibacterium sp.]